MIYVTTNWPFDALNDNDVGNPNVWYLGKFKISKRTVCLKYKQCVCYYYFSSGNPVEYFGTTKNLNN